MLVTYSTTMLHFFVCKKIEVATVRLATAVGY
jgi:hypothetical protein